MTMMTATEIRVAQIMSAPERLLPFAEIGPQTAMAQDALIDGIDVDDFVIDMESEFGPVVRDIPWLLYSDQRASFRGCAVLLVPFCLLTRLLRRSPSDPVLPRPDPTRYPRLTVRHMAQVIDQGYWTDPK